MSLSTARRDSVALLHSLGDGNALIAQHLPGGFAGWYFDPNHRFTVNFVDTTNLASSLDSLADYWTRTSLVRDSVMINVVRWDWIQLNDWDKYIAAFGRLMNQRSSRIDVLTNRLVYGVWSDVAATAMLQRLLQIGVPCWLVAVETTLPCPNGSCLKSAQPPPTATGVVAP